MKSNIRFWIGLVGLGFLALSPLAQSASDPAASAGAPRSSVTFTSDTRTITVTDLGLPPVTLPRERWRSTTWGKS